MPQILQSSYFSPFQQISMDRMRLTGQIWRDKNLKTPKPPSIYIQKKLDRRLHVVSSFL